MENTGEIIKGAEKNKSFTLNLPTQVEQRGILGALTLYMPSHQQDSNGQIAKEMFGTITHHLDNRDDSKPPPESLTLDLKTLEKQQVLRAALFSTLHAETAAQTFDDHKTKNTDLAILRKYFKEINTHLGEQYQLTEIQKLSLGIVDDISDERLKEIAIDPDPSKETLRAYAEYFLRHREN